MPVAEVLLGVGVAAGLTILVALLTRVRSLSGVVEHTSWCPVARAVVTARFRGERVGEPAEVLSCTAFDPPAGLTCQRVCLFRAGADAVSGLGLRER
jgi:hypothetical protein